MNIAADDINAFSEDNITDCPTVTRVEVIGSDGRELVKLNLKNVKISIQDQGRTMKVFIN